MKKLFLAKTIIERVKEHTFQLYGF